MGKLDGLLHSPSSSSNGKGEPPSDEYAEGKLEAVRRVRAAKNDQEYLDAVKDLLELLK